MNRIVLVSALLAAIAGTGCGDDECTTGVDGDGITIALDGMCLEGLTARVRRSGVWSAPNDASAPALEWEAVDEGGYRLTMVADAPAEGLELTLPGVEVDRMLQQGYQSWSFTGSVVIPRLVTMHDDGAPLMEAAGTGDPVHEERGVSYYATLFRRGQEGKVLVVGSLTAEIAVTGMAAVYDLEGKSDITVIYGPQREELPSGADGSVRSEPIYVVTADSPEQGMDLLSAQMQAAHADSGFTPTRPPAGWFSWNEHFADIDEALIHAHADLAVSDLVPLGMKLVEIDDGWELAWGDWRANDRFPDGMEATATVITDKGLVAGIWLAPFLVDVESDAAELDSGLFVQAPEGGRLLHRISGNPRRFHILDGTNPEAMAVVTDEIARLAAAGYTFFKLDFLYAGAIAGGRSQDVTGVQALRQGMAMIREATGGSAVINACGSPTLPIIGFADSLRVGPDTAFDGFDLTWGIVAAAGRNIAYRAHLWPLIWPDADQVQLRAPYAAEEARAGALVAALAGPAYSLGDDLTTLADDLFAIATSDTVLDIAGAERPARALGLMEPAGEEIATTPVIESIRFPEGYAVPPPTRFEIVGASGTTYTVDIDWADSHTATVTHD